MTPWTTSGRTIFVPTAATRMSHSRDRSKAPPMTQPLRAQMMGQGMVKNIWEGRWPRSMNSRSEMSSVRRPSWSVSRPDENDLPCAPPHDGPQLGHLVHLGQHLEQPPVHLVAHGVVLLGPVVGDDGDGTVHLQRHQALVLGAQGAHGRAPLAGPGPGSNGGRPSCSRIGVNGGWTVWRRCQLAPSTTSEWPLM